ncbi:hypothetical protein [Sphingobacterium daejeonense]
MRVKQINSNSLALAEFFEKHSAIKYTGLYRFEVAPSI